MRFFASLLLITGIGTQGFCYARFAHIEAKAVSCQSYTYDIILHTTYTTGADLLFSSIELNYGDGTYDELRKNDAEKMLINKDVEYNKFIRRHTFSGPGTYIISCRIFNRIYNINNMDNSVNTPLFVETELILDPVIGCNNTPFVENLPFLRYKAHDTYLQDFSVIDQEGDSVSFIFTTPLQNENIQVINYKYLFDHISSPAKKISKISIDPYTGLQLFNNQHSEGLYTMVVEITEWRKIANQYNKISRSMADYTFELHASDNQAPVISGIKDTVLITNNHYTNEFVATDPDGDSLQILIFGDVLNLSDSPPQNDFDFAPASVNFNFNLTLLEKHIRSKPYKLVVSSTDQRSNKSSYNQTRSMYVWITDRQHRPSPPAQLITQLLNTDKIGIYWNDTNDELGYILERSDLYFPVYEKIAVLPANRTSFIDLGVVIGNTYNYRIKAVGTQMSTYVLAEISTPEIITGMVEQHPDSNVTVYPNPTHGFFTISSASDYSTLKIMDLSGKTVITKNIQEPGNFSSSYTLPPGIYIIQISDSKNSAQIKLSVL